MNQKILQNVGKLDRMGMPLLGPFIPLIARTADTYLEFKAGSLYFVPSCRPAEVSPRKLKLGTLLQIPDLDAGHQALLRKLFFGCTV